MKTLSLLLIFLSLAGFIELKPSGLVYGRSARRLSTSANAGDFTKVLCDSIPDFGPDDIANAFDYPVGKPDAVGYYNAQPFGKNHHLGDDWNAVTGERRGRDKK